MKFYYQKPFLLESGEKLSSFHLEYTVYGDDFNKPILWIIHALTGDSKIENWWNEVLIDTQIISNFCLICVNNPGSPYGSLSPMDINPKNHKKFYRDFPLITTRDVAKMFDILRVELGIGEIEGLIGASLGAQIALEWNILQPNVFKKHLNIAGNAQHSAWGIAFNEAQRMAIYSDPTYFQDFDQGGKEGLKAARAMAMLSYRSYSLYQLKQSDNNHKINHFKSADYQQYHGNKLAARFNAYSYVALTKMMDSHNIFRNRLGNPLENISTYFAFLGIDSDILFPIQEQKFLKSLTKNSELITLNSIYGHDAFLVETNFMKKLLTNIFNHNKK